MMEGNKEGLKKEYDELKEKTEILAFLLETEEYTYLQPTQRNLLKMQFNTMKTYLLILEERLK